MVSVAKYFRRYTPRQIDEFLTEKNRFEELLLKKWNDEQLDGLICPAYPSCAFKIDYAEQLGTLAEYAMLWNIIPFPAGVV